jgi:hypothetical protein
MKVLQEDFRECVPPHRQRILWRKSWFWRNALANNLQSNAIVKF